MGTENDELLKMLKEIRDLLIPISACSEEQYSAVWEQRRAEKLQALLAILTPARRKIYPLLFDSHRLSQGQIAEIVGANQSTVSVFVSRLLEESIIELTDDREEAVYQDKYCLSELLEDMEEEL